MANIRLGAGRQNFLFERNGEADTIRDFRSLYFAATLDESQEVPPNNNIARIDGTGVGSLNLPRTRFEFGLDIDGIDLGGGNAPDDMVDAHIHGAEVGATGPVIFDFLNDVETNVNVVAGRISGGWDRNEQIAFDLTPANLADLLGEDTYFNIHTNRDPSGFIRGQILRDGGVGDRIDLTDHNIGSFATLRAITANQRGDAVISTFFNGQESSLRLDGIPEAALRARFFDFAGSAAETIRGTGARDDLFGAGGRDAMNGRGGADRIFGEDGADALLGRGGRDDLVGGLGRDLMTGGTLADRFVFDSTGDTGDTRRTADRITDFLADRDLIVLAGIDARAGVQGNQAFTFIGGDAFNAAGQVQVTTGGAGTFIALNTAGAGDAEAIIRLDGALALTEDSFVL